MATTGSTGALVGGRYRIDALLGRGGMGVVWSGVDTLLERPVAIKEIHLPVAMDERERARYQARVLREARAAARLNHASVVAVYDIVDEGERPYIVMELVPAPSLDEIVGSGGPVTPERAAAIGLGIAAALQAAHRKGIVHRDVKPANVLVPDDGPVRLTDFGIASIADDASATTQHVVGSPTYMSPEQAANATLTEATDRWSLGATLYYAVEGRPPFDRGEAIPTLTAVLHDPPRPPERAEALGPLLLRLLEKDPAARPNDDAVLAALGQLAHPGVTRDDTVRLAAPVPRQPAPAPAPARRSSEVVAPRPAAGRRSPARLVLAVLAGIAIVGAAVLLGRAQGSGPSPSSATSASSSTTARPTTTAPGKATTTTTKAAAAGAVPPGWVAYHDPATGFTIAHPDGWSVSTHGTQTDFRDPASGTYLRVDHISPPHSDAEADWRAYEPSFAAANPGYQRIQITPTTFQGFRAATWEYTYSGHGTALHAVDLGFIVGSSYGFALNFQAPADQWQAMQPQFDSFKRSFTAPSS